MPQDTPSRHLDQYLLRFPAGMRDRLKNEAAKNGRSLNAEIIARLAVSFEPAREAASMLTPELEEIIMSVHAMLTKDPRIAKDLADRIYVDDPDAD